FVQNERIVQERPITKAHALREHNAQASLPRRGQSSPRDIPLPPPFPNDGSESFQLWARCYEVIQEARYKDSGVNLDAVLATELPIICKGNHYVLVVMDYFTKYLNLYALANQRATTVAKCLFEDYVSQHGVPQSLHTDQGRQFDSDLVKELCSLLGIHKTQTSYHAMSDGMVERANRTVKDQLAKYLYTKRGEWDDHLKQVEFAYNTSVHSSTKHTPFFLAHGREARLPADFLLGIPPATSRAISGTPNEYVHSMLGRLRSAFTSVADNIQTAGVQQKHYYDRHIRHTAYQPNDLVWVDFPALSRHKLSPKWAGPYKVLSRLDSPTGDMGVTYKVKDLLDSRSKPKVIHYNRLKPYRSAWSPEPSPLLTSPQGERPPLTALSGSRPYGFHDSFVPEPVSVTVMSVHVIGFSHCLPPSICLFWFNPR
ncbi:hypothetical protein M9458_053985, partial [Cirrhinus mrigala]